MKLLSVLEAQDRILKHFQPVGTETLPLQECGGRVLASDVLSTDLPLFDNSSVDGFAVIAADIADASAGSPQTLRVIADIPAGANPEVALETGKAARIMTGAPIPRGADAVLMIEDTDFKRRDSALALPEKIKALKPVAAGENIRKRGMDLTRGRVVLEAGHRLRAPDLGMLAMLNRDSVVVFRQPQVAIFSSGDELVEVGAKLTPGKIRETNSHMLSALIAGAGCRVVSFGIAPDERGAIRLCFEQAIASHVDLIVSSAGVSVGALDFVREIVASAGHLDFWGVNVRPGKPLAFGKYRGVPFIGLPGNPVSAFVGFELFVRPSLMRLAGLTSTRRVGVRVVVQEDIESDGRESYLRAIVEERDGEWFARLTGHQGSGNLFSLVEANALLIVPAGVKSLAIGDRADAWLL